MDLLNRKLLRRSLAEPFSWTWYDRKQDPTCPFQLGDEGGEVSEGSKRDEREAQL